MHEKFRILKILLVEDDEDSLFATKYLLEADRFAIETADSMRTALDAARRNFPDILITDFGLPDGSGADLLREMKGQSDLKGILITGRDFEDLPQTDTELFIAHFIKPLKFEMLTSILRKLERMRNVPDPIGDGFGKAA